MISIPQTLNRSLSVLGVPGIVGLGIVIASLVFYDAAIRPLQQMVRQRQQSLNQPRELVKTAPRTDWRSLPASLPPQAQADAQAASIYRLAQEAEIDLREAEYKEENLDKAHMVVRHLNFSASGDYFHLRQFLSSALNEIPSLALDAVSFQKSKDADGLLNVRIELTLYVAR